jgi:WD40 repeat protein
MATCQSDTRVHSIRRIAGGPATDAPADHELPTNSICHRDWKALTALFGRNAPRILCLLAGLAVAGGSLLARQVRSAGRPQSEQAEARASANADARVKKEVGNPARTDRFGDLLPNGAVARLGTVRWRLDPALADCMAISPDGKTLFTANCVTGITRWDMSSGKALGVIPGANRLPPAQRHGTTAISADGRTGALANPDGVVRLFDLLGGKEKRPCVGHQGEVQEAVLSANGATLLTRGVDSTLRVWDANAGVEIRQMPIHSHKPSQVRRVELALTGDGKTLAWVADDQDRTVHVCDTLTGREAHRLPEPQGPMRRVLFSPDGKRLVTTGNKGPVQVWNVQTGQLVRRLPYFDRFGPMAAAFSPDSQALVITLGGDAMRIVEIASGREFWREARPLSSTIFDVFAFTRDGKTLVVGTYEPALRRYDVATGRRIWFQGEQTAALGQLVFASDSRLLYSIGEDMVLRRWRSARGEELGQTSFGGSDGVLSPDGRLIAVNRDRGIRVIEMATARELWQTPAERAQVFSPDGQTLAVSDQRGLVLRETATGKQVCRVGPFGGELYDSAFTPDGGALIAMTSSLPVRPGAARMEGSILHVWDVNGGLERRSFHLPPNSGQLALSPDSRAVAIQNDGGNRALDIWEMATGQRRLQFGSAELFPGALGFSPDGEYLLVPDSRGALGFYDSGTGQLMQRLEGHRGNVTTWVFSADGRKLATASADTTALVWDYAELRRRWHRPSPPAHADLDALWDDLSSSDVEKAYRALRALVNAANQAVPFLGQRLRPAEAVDPETMTGWVAELDSSSFAARKKAREELEKAGDAAEPFLIRSLQAKPSAERRRELKQLLAVLDWGARPERLRMLRSIEALEAIGTVDAQRVLSTLAAGAPGSRLTQEAKDSLERAAKRKAAFP